MNREELWRKPVSLAGKVVRLEPLAITDIPGLVLAGKDESIWKYMLYGNLSIPENMYGWVKEMLTRQANGDDLPFIVISKLSGQVIGSTRYLEMRPVHRSLEIGGTWYAPEFQRTKVNTECKYLLLEYAFEKLKCIRVQFKVDAQNAHSIRAIERLGAVREGVLRNHLILPNGRWRDSIYFSILDREWQDVKTQLEQRLME